MEKLHTEKTLMSWSKKDLVDYIRMLEHNNNNLDIAFDNQYRNCLKIIDDMKLINDSYIGAKNIVNKSDIENLNKFGDSKNE